MKKNLFLILWASPIMLSGQLEVQPNGDTYVGKNIYLESPTNFLGTTANNVPNPFNQSTQIKYYLPETVSKALLCIYNLQGKQLKQIMITQRGYSIETVFSSEFSAGIYLYALIADGNQMDVKRMILTE